MCLGPARKVGPEGGGVACAPVLQHQTVPVLDLTHKPGAGGMDMISPRWAHQDGQRRTLQARRQRKGRPGKEGQRRPQVCLEASSRPAFRESVPAPNPGVSRRAAPTVAQLQKELCPSGERIPTPQRLEGGVGLGTAPHPPPTGAGSGWGARVKQTARSEAGREGENGIRRGHAPSVSRAPGAREKLSSD